jgi:hypothetical protein
VDRWSVLPGPGHHLLWSCRPTAGTRLTRTRTRPASGRNSADSRRARYIQQMVDRQDVVGNLRDYRKHLLAELKRVETALRAFNALDEGVGGAATVRVRTAPRPGASGTFDLLRAVFQDDPTGVIDADEAVARITQRGWQSEAGNPLNAVRTALARMVTWDELEREGRGKYRLARPPQPESDSTEPEPEPVRIAQDQDDFTSAQVG